MAITVDFVAHVWVEVSNGILDCLARELRILDDASLSK